MFFNTKLISVIIVIIGTSSLVFLWLSTESNIVDQPNKSSFQAKSNSYQSQNNQDIVLQNQNSNPTQTQTQPLDQNQIENTQVSSRLLFMGDVFWGRSINKWSLDSDLKYDYPFSGLPTFERDKYDAWIANLECPITTRNMTPAEQEQGLRFTCLPEYLPSARKFFDVFSQANNHTDNQEQIQGLKTTRDYLDKEGFQYFGHFENRKTEDICEVVSLPAKSTKDQINHKTILIPIALCGYNNVFKLPNETGLKVISTYSQFFPTIIMPHQGQEYVNKPDKYKVDTYRKMIDYGADLVVGAHPHVVQSTEVYKDRLIVYSLGNFIFDQQNGKNVTQHAVLDATLNILDYNTQNTQSWLQLAQNCTKFKDDCLDQAKNQSLTKPKFSFKYDLIASQNRNKITYKADEKIEKEIFTIANWFETKKQLEQIKN